MSTNELNVKQMDSVAGGQSGSDSNYPSCPYCGSSNVRIVDDHDEIGVFQCNSCHKQFSKRYGE